MLGKPASTKLNPHGHVTKPSSMQLLYGFLMVTICWLDGEEGGVKNLLFFHILTPFCPRPLSLYRSFPLSPSLPSVSPPPHLGC